jgi:autotransporter-associated beta strand protein
MKMATRIVLPVWLAMGCLSWCSQLKAADVVWDANGGTGGNFTTAANWVGDIVPGTVDLARIDSNTSQANPVTFAAGQAEVDNVNLGATTASYMEINGGTLVALGSGTGDFSIGVGSSQQSTLTLSSGTLQFGTPGVYTDGNDFDIGKNGNGRLVQTGGLFQQHADDVKLADSAAGVGLLDISGGQMFVSDGFSVSDNAGGTGTLNVSGTAEVVSGNSAGRGGVGGTVASGYISVANGGGTGTIIISGDGALYGRYLEYRGSTNATANITIGGTGGKLVISEEQVTGLPGSGSGQNVIGNQPGATGTITVQESGMFAVDNQTYFDYSDGYVIGRAGSGSLSVAGTNARVVVRERLLVASGGADMDFLSGNPGSDPAGSASMTVGEGGNVAVSELQIGVTGTGTLTQVGGAIAADNESYLFAEAGFANGVYGQDVVVGSLVGSTGTYTQSGGTVSTRRDFVIGDYGSGTYAISGTAYATVGNAMMLARQTGSTAAVTLSGGEATANRVNVGELGSATASVANGRLLAGGGSLFVGGQNDVGTGSLTLGQGGVALSDDDIQFGRVGTGTLTMNTGSYMNGIYTVVGKYGTGTWNQTGGVYYQQGGDFEIGDGGKPADYGIAGPRAGVVNLSGGVIDVAESFAIGNRIGSGIVTITGGGLTTYNDLYVGRGMNWTPADVAAYGVTGNAVELVIGGDDSVITIGRDFVMDPNNVFESATLKADITGATHTPLLVGRNANIANGSFAVTLNGYSPVAGDQWTIIKTNLDMSAANAEISGLAAAENVPTYYNTTGGVIPSELRFNNDAFFTNPIDPDYIGVAGQFASVDYTGATLSAGLSFQLDYTQNSVVLKVVGSSADIAIDVASGTRTQAQAGYPTISAADSVTKTGAGTVVFDAANAYTGPTTVSVGTLEVANANALAATNVTVDTGATLAIASGTTMKSPAVIVDGGTLSGGAVAVNSSTGITSLAINAGTISGAPTVTIGTGGQMSLVQDARVTVSVGGLSVDQASGGGRLDLGAGQVSIAAGGISAADLRADIIAGRNGGAWTGTTGITSSTAAASGGTRAVGYVVAGDGSATVSFAAAGDTNLNGTVDVFDLVAVNSGGKYGAGSAAVWSQGDFNYDGVTNVFDLVSINGAGAYGQGNYFPAAPSASGIGSVAAVPEPASVSLLAVAAGLAGLAARRR